MPVVALQEYIGQARDVHANYHGNQVLYVCWEKHLMFAAPFALLVAPTLKFSELVDQMIAPVIALHPDASKIDWRLTQWEKCNKSWTPIWDQSVTENGLQHKQFLSFTTPGLHGYKGLGI